MHISKTNYDLGHYNTNKFYLNKQTNHFMHNTHNLVARRIGIK